MANLSLRRFNKLTNYSKAAAITDPTEKGYIADGTFFVIEDTKQLGVRKGTLDILTPSGNIDWQGDSLKDAIQQLENRITNLADNTEYAVNTATRVEELIQEYSTGVDYLGLADKVKALDEKIVILSEEEFENKEGLDPTKIYYVYEND